MWKVNIISSKKADRYYAGISDDLEWRMERHNGMRLTGTSLSNII